MNNNEVLISRTLQEWKDMDEDKRIAITKESLKLRDRICSKLAVEGITQTNYDLITALLKLQSTVAPRICKLVLLSHEEYIKTHLPQVSLLENIHIL